MYTEYTLYNWYIDHTPIVIILLPVHAYSLIFPCSAHCPTTASHTALFQTLALSQGVNDNGTAATHHIHQVPLHSHRWPRCRPLSDNSSCSWSTRTFCSRNTDLKCCAILRWATTKDTVFNIVQWDIFIAFNYNIIEIQLNVVSYSGSFSFLQEEESTYLHAYIHTCMHARLFTIIRSVCVYIKLCYA